MKTQEALESLALTLVRYRYSSTGKAVTSEAIATAVNECMPLLAGWVSGGVTEGERLVTIAALATRLLPKGSR